MLRRTLSCAVIAVCLASPVCAAPVRPTPPRVERPDGRRYEPSFHVLIGASLDARAEDGLPYVRDPDGRISIVPPAPSEWDARTDLAANTFVMSAAMRLPSSIVSRDVASLRAVMRGADRGSVSVETDDDMTELSISGAVEAFGSLDDVELVQLIVEKDDGITLVQEMNVGLRYVPRY